MVGGGLALDWSMVLISLCRVGPCPLPLRVALKLTRPNKQEGEGEGVREEWSKSCDVITFCVNRFWGLFGFPFKVESKILLCSPQVITFKLQTCHQ